MKSLIWILYTVLSISTFVEGSWDIPGTSQYHIQTDEGPERYFRFQTDNGQFRKEKRLRDGTVIGTEAWIDAAGYLRQKDYIADTQGYRILKSKTVFVGQGRPIEDAIKSTKSVAAQSGVLIAGSNHGGPNSIDHSTQYKHQSGYVYSTTPVPATERPATPSLTKPTSPARTFGYLSPAEAAKLEPSPYLGYDHYPDELAHRTHTAAQPVGLIHPNSEHIEGYNDQDIHTFGAPRRAIPARPSLTIEPPLPPSNYHRVQPIAVASSNPTPISGREPTAFSSPTVDTLLTHSNSSPAPFGTGSGSGYYYAPSKDDEYDGASSHTRGSSDSNNARPASVAMPLDINSLSALQPPHLPTHYRRREKVQSPLVYSNTLGSGYGQSQDGGSVGGVGDYDGVANTRNGFRYFLPHQYHEEEEVGGDKRAGSFGYVDPFGIRRVIYYNASPEKGFVHRKNNRYVGINAAPYDSRPPY